MKLVLATVLVVLVTAAAVAQFVLLILKTDGEAGFSHHTVALPAFIAFPLATAVFGALAVWELATRGHPLHVYTLAAMALLAAGTLWTTGLLVRKFDLVQNVRHLHALLPVTVAMVLSAVLFFVGVVLQRARQQRKQQEARDGVHVQQKQARSRWQH